jgi:alpha-L-arabinofuranosidase
MRVVPSFLSHMNTPSVVLFSSLALTAALCNGADAASLKATVSIAADKPGAVISREIYGQFAEHLGHGIYGGVWVGESSKIPNTRGIRNDVVDALRKLAIPVVRWPGGCFADEYHWKDGIGRRDKRPSMINTNWGGVVEDNSFGTHEFLDFCDLIGAQPYICGNLGSGTVQEMMEWVEYMTSDAQSPMANLRRANGRDKPWTVQFFAVGNESWGCGGNMTPEFYCDNFRRYNVYLKNYAGNKLIRIASGPSADDYNWTKVCMDRIDTAMDAISLHYYTIPTGDWSHKGSATQFTEAEWFATLKGTLFMDELIARHSAIMDKKDPAKRIGLYVDEWGTWYDAEPGTNPGFLVQQNSLRDAMVAALNFNIFQAHADRVRMANIAQMVNVLQAMVMTDGPRMCVTPTYHVFEMYKVHQGATLLPVAIKGPDYTFGGKSILAISATASRDARNVIHVSLVNVDPNAPADVECDISGATVKTVAGRVLTADAMDAHNTFDNPDVVHPVEFTGAELADGKLVVHMPAKSIVVMELK